MIYRSIQDKEKEGKKKKKKKLIYTSVHLFDDLHTTNFQCQQRYQ